MACDGLQAWQPLTANSILGGMNHLDALNLAQLRAVGKTHGTCHPRKVKQG
jgi:hypothetical protein